MFNFATNFYAGVTSRFCELLFRGFSLCANSWIFLHILARFLALFLNFVCILFLLIGTNWQIWILCCVALYLAIVEYRTWQAGQTGIIHSQVLDHILHIRVVDPEWFVSDPSSDPNPTLKEVSAPKLSHPARHLSNWATHPYNWATHLSTLATHLLSWPTHLCK